MAKTAGRKPKRPKAVKAVLIPRPEKVTGRGSDHDNPYAILEEVRRDTHGHLIDANIALAFQRDVQPDKDGRVWIVKARKEGDPAREKTGFDFLLTINEALWRRYDRKQKLGVCDDGLSRCGVVVDREGEIQKDEKDRNVYRLIKPDVVTFTGVIERRGFYTAALSQMARVTGKRLELNEPLWDYAPDGAPTIPFANVGSQAAPPNNGKGGDDAWKGVTLLDALGPLGKINQVLDDAHLRTLGELAEWTVRKRLTDINGIGPAAAAKIEVALESYWKANKPLPMAEAARNK